MAWVHQRDEVDDCPSKLRGKRDGSESEHGGANDHEVADRPYNRGENVISPRIAKISRIDRSRFSPSQHGNSCEHSNEGQEYGSERVDVLDRIQRDAAQHTRGRVTAAVCHPGVCRLMHADGEQEHDQLKQNVNMLQGHAGMSSILTCVMQIQADGRMATRFPCQLAVLWVAKLTIRTSIVGLGISDVTAR